MRKDKVGSQAVLVIAKVTLDRTRAKANRVAFRRRVIIRMDKAKVTSILFIRRSISVDKGRSKSSLIQIRLTNRYKKATSVIIRTEIPVFRIIKSSVITAMLPIRPYRMIIFR